MPSSTDIVTEAQATAFLRRCRQDPVYFVKVVIGAEPTKQQRLLLEAIAKPGAHVSVKSGHGTGKSAALAWCILWFISTRPDALVPCTAPTAHQLEDVLWTEARRWYDRMHPYFRNQLEFRSAEIHVKETNGTSFACARTARKEKPDALQGFHSANVLYIIDEAAGVEDVIFEVAETALTTPGARVLMTANPTRTNGFFYQSHHRNRERWDRLTFNAEETDLVTDDQVQYYIDTYGRNSDQYRVRVLGEFPESEIDQLISRSLAESRVGHHLRAEQYNFAPKILGVDVAWEGDDNSVIYLRQGLYSKMLKHFPQIDNMTLADEVARIEDTMRIDATFIDMGWGVGVIDRLRQLGRNPIPIAFNGKALDIKYFNKRAEMWCMMKEWLAEGGVLQDDNFLIEDMVAPHYSMNTTGKIVLESKREIKKRGLPSPDRADALALTFAMPVQPRHRHWKDGSEINTVQRTTNTKYEVFS